MIQYLPMIANLVQSGIGAIEEGKKRAAMQKERAKWDAENENMFNADYYGDFTKRADNQRLIKQMREEQQKQNTVEQNTAAVTGATPEAVNAGKDSRNKVMSDVFSRIAANGQAFKDRSKENYLARKHQLQGLEYDDMNQNAISANNMLYNGVKGVAGTDWAGIMGGKVKTTPIP